MRITRTHTEKTIQRKKTKRKYITKKNLRFPDNGVEFGTAVDSVLLLAIC